MSVDGLGRRTLQTMLHPRRIAVVGASDQPGNLATVAIGHLRRLGYPGEIWPVHPTLGSVAGLPCSASIGDVPGPVDLAILAVRAESVPALARECAAAGVGGAVVWAGGFAESGAEGAALQDELASVARETGLPVLGPNCIGFIETHGPTIASFASFLQDVDALYAGHISMVSQSGGLATQAQALAQLAGSGFRYMVSTGNEADLTVADIIELFADDPETHVIAVYVEGIRDGARFVRALAKAASSAKPVVLLKGGVAAAGAEAASAHTGALAGEDRVLAAILDRHGVVRVHSLEELLDTALLAASLHGAADSDLRGDGLAVVTFGGGGGVLAADQAASAGLDVPRLTDETRARLAGLLPPIASLLNPVDVTPQTFNQPRYLAQFGEALGAIAADPGVDALLAILGPMRVGVAEVVAALTELRDEADIPVVIAWPFCPAPTRLELLDRGFHVFDEPSRAIRALGRLALRRPAVDQAAEPTRLKPVDWAALVPDPVAGTVLSERACHEVLAAAGLPVAWGRLMHARSEVAAAADGVGLPAVLKGESPHVLHRDAAGLVALDLRTLAEAESAYDHLTARAAELGIELEGVYMQEMISSGTEILVSAFRDPVFGAMVSVGAGGTLTEVLDDVAIAPAPVDARGAEDLLRSLRIVRHAERKDRGKGKGKDGRIGPMADFVAQLSALAVAAPWERFVLEVNPVRWRDTDVVAVDGLLVIERP